MNPKKPRRSCLNCQGEVKRVDAKYCSYQCMADYTSRQVYEKFLQYEDCHRDNYHPKQFKKYILQEQDCKCVICGMKNEWQGKELIFILDHINGNGSDNRRCNLRLVCPNCDSQLDTYKSKNKGNGRKYRRENYLKNHIPA